jgi:3-oxoacyl-[acyl-carrier-protein] synthase II
MDERKTVITGLGVIASIGKNGPEFWENLIAGKTGIGEVDLFDPSPFRVKIAAQVRGFTGEGYFSDRERRRFSRCDLLGLVAAREALKDCGLNFKTVVSDRVAVVLGAGAGGVYPAELYRIELYRRKRGRHPALLLSYPMGSLSDHLGNQWGFTGPRATIDTACSSTITAIGFGSDLIQRGQADLVVAGGAESLSQLTFSGFNALKALDPEPCRPFDRHRQGLSLGEGAAMIILEEKTRAENRGARIYGEVLGYGTSGDAHHITAPHPEGAGAALSMKRAIAQAGIDAREIDFINAHGTATLANDPIETKAIKEVFGRRAYEIPVTSIKSSIGHCLGSAGVLSAVSSIYSLRYGILPPTLHFQERDPACDLDVVFNQARTKTIQKALCNAFAFGGNNSSIIFSRY